MEDEVTPQSDEGTIVNYDPNYKWRVVAGLCTILLTLVAVVLVITVSKAQSKESSIFIFGMGIAIAIIVVMTLFRYPSETQHPIPTDRPVFVVSVAVIAELIASIISIVVLHSLER